MPAKLKHDEWNTIIAFLSQSDVLNIMDASPALYERGLPVLLRSPIIVPPESVTMKRVLQVSGLVAPDVLPADLDISRLMSVGHLFRDLRIRAMGIPAQWRPPPVCKLLHVATGLHSLDIRDSAYAYRLFPELPRLIGGLIKLTRLALSEANKSLCQELMRYPLSLTHLYISFNSRDVFGDQPWKCDFASMLNRCSATLESIHLSHVKFSSIAELVFPRAHTLGIQYFEIGVRRNTLVHQLPRLSTLYIGELFLSAEERTTLIQWHAINSLEPSQPQIQWSHLERVSAPYTAIYGLHLRCTAHFLRFDVALQHADLADPQVLVNCQPQSISVRVWDNHLEPLQVFLSRAPQLTHIGVHLLCHSLFNIYSNAEEVLHCIDSCIQALRSSSCTHLFVNLACDTEYVEDLHPLLFGYWQHRCMFAQQLVDAIPSIQSIHLATYYTGANKVWLGEVVNLSGRRTVQQVEELPAVPEHLSAFREEEDTYRWT
ncbi:hypothetical protein K474DRAFT_1663524 [Panus rudis PR-1116 ss-1]|nr:hypothetical protein K474DRAFT_1663524 [Panus rudis PR-1116 ss-1]